MPGNKIKAVSTEERIVARSKIPNLFKLSAWQRIRNMAEKHEVKALANTVDPIYL
jgi:hypothetical protein